MQDISLDLFDQTREKLGELRPAKLTTMAYLLGYPQSAAGMLSDVLHGRHDHVSDARLNDLRRRLKLPHTVTVQAIPCPTCNIVHGAGYDCQGARLQIVRRKAPRRIQDMTVKALTFAIENRQPLIP